MAGLMTGDGDRLPYELAWRDSDFKPVIGLRQIISAVVQLKLNDASSWTVIVDGDAPLMPFVATADEPDYQAGILMSHPDYGYLFSGPLTRVVSIEDDTTVIGTTTTGGGRYELSGMGDTGLLALRRVYPDPVAGIVDNAWSQESDDVAMTAEEDLYYYIEANATGGDAAALGRTIPGLALTAIHSPPLNDPETIEVHGKLETLLELCQRIAWQADPRLIFWVLQNDSRELAFQAEVPTDRTAGNTDGNRPAIFTVQGRGAQRFERTTSAATATHVIVGGKGEADSQAYAEGTASTGPRVEAYVHDGTAEDAAQLDLAILPALEDGRSITSVTLVPAETGGLVYGPDYRLGDKVTIRVGSLSTDAIVTDVKFEFSGDGVKVTPTLSTRGATRQMARGSGDVRRLSERISLLERTMTTFPVTADPDTNRRIQMQHGINSTGSARFEADDDATIGAVVKGAPAQVANLQEWQDDAGAVLAAIGPDGTFSGGAAAALTDTELDYGAHDFAVHGDGHLTLDAEGATHHVGLLANSVEGLRVSPGFVDLYQLNRLTEQAGNVPGSDLTNIDGGLGTVALYVKGDKLVIAYKLSGTVQYLTIALDGATADWGIGTTAP